MSTKPHFYLFIAACFALVLGLCIYLLDRQPDAIYFVSKEISLYDKKGPVFGLIGYYLPAFIHVYAFILLSVVVFAQTHRQILIICAGWLTIDSLFEVGQINFIAESIASHTPGWFAGVPFLENTANYFLMGTFDILDLLSIAAGTLTAYITINLSKERQ